jgi:hypothetical protein
MWGSEFTTNSRYNIHYRAGGKQNWYYRLGVAELARCVGAAARRKLHGGNCTAATAQRFVYGPRPSVRLCMGPELARCVHTGNLIFRENKIARRGFSAL